MIKMTADTNKEKTISTSDSTSKSPLSSDLLKTISHSPGVYIMSGKREILYVGKACDLRKRLSQYAHFTGSVHSKTAVMLKRIRRVESILTTTEKEALLLEASLIKKHRPRYNVILRDDKNYPLIKITVRDKWPKIVITRKRIRDGSRYFGPFPSSSAMRITLKLFHNLFPLRRCKTVQQRNRPCLNYQMGQCLAPCTGQVEDKRYKAMVKESLLFMEGKNRRVLAGLKIKMTSAAGKLDYEQAAMFRDQITALEKTLEQQSVAGDHFQDQDVFGLARQGAAVGIAVLFVRRGMISGSQNFFIPDPLGKDDKILTETIMQYYSTRRHPPGELLVPLAIVDQKLVVERLGELREGSTVSVITPKRGKRMQLMEMAKANAVQVFSRHAEKEKSWQSLNKTLQTKLHLKNKPTRIECLDISNLSGKQAVGSLSCFVKGEADKTAYRHYRIRLKDEPDDYAMMREVLTRRIESGLGKKNLPDMILLDGGKGQLSIGVEVLSQYNLLATIDLVAIAKEKQDEGEKLFRPGRKNPIMLKSHAPALLYLMRIRDESHRFGVTFHRKLRNKQTISSPLDKLSGIGPQRKKQLLKSLGSYKRICNATLYELSEVEGIGSELAHTIRDQLHQNTEN
jgi:excinuclease ABC subunit C